MSDIGQVINEDINEPSHYAMIPKMAMMDLGPYELTLYCHYKMTASEHGRCWKSNSTLAKETGMSVRKVQDMRGKLAEKGYITISYEPDEDGNVNKPPTISIVNRWAENRRRYSKPNTPPPHDTHTPHAQGAYPHAQGAPKEESVKKNSKKESASSIDEPSQPQMLMKSHIAKWGKEKLTTYFQENEQEVTPLYNLLGIALAVVPVENLTLTRRRDVTWAHLWMSRSLETAGYTVGQYVAWLKTETAWRKGAAKVTVKELMDKVAVFISAQRETPAPAPRGELVPDYRPAPVVDELTPEERAHRLELIRAGRREWEMQTA